MGKRGRGATTQISSRAWIAVKGQLYNHWSRNDFSRIFSKHTQILDIGDSTLEKTNLSVTRLYVSCDEIGSIPKGMMVIIRSSCFSINIKIEAHIRESTEVRVLKEEMERGKMLLEGSLGVYQSLETNEEQLSNLNEMPREDLKSPQLQAQTSSRQVTGGTPEIETHPIGRTRPRLTPTI